MTNRNIRNNNPGNLEFNSNIKWVGQTGIEPPNGVGAQRFAAFETPEHGVRASVKNMYTKQRRNPNLTTRELIGIWAPPHENNTDAYIRRVASDIGLGPDDKLPDLQDNPEVTAKLMKAVAKHEGDNENYFNDEIIDNGIRLANGEDAEFSGQTPSEQVEETEVVEETDEEVVEEQPVTEEVPQSIADRETVTSQFPGNWMSNYDQTTYRITLYLTDADAHNNPRTWLDDDTVATNNGKALIIAESGVTTEFTIDNLLMMSNVLPTAKSGFTQTGIFQFQLYEPLGFTFYDKMMKAGAFFGFNNIASASFVLSIEFIGRDSSNGSPVRYSDSKIHYPCKINTIQAQLNEQGAVYDIVMMNTIQAALVESTNETPLNIPNVTTVDNFLSGLMTEWNNSLKSSLRGTGNQTPSVTYNYAYGDNTELTLNTGDSVVNFNLKDALFSPAGTSTDANARDETGSMVTVEAQSNMVRIITEKLGANTPSFNEYVRSSKENTGIHPVIQVIPKITRNTQNDIGQSTNTSDVTVTYIVNLALTVSSIDSDMKRVLSDITNVPAQRSFFKIVTNEVAKVYDYLYTGLNTEVEGFELNYNAMFMNTIDPGKGSYYDAGSQSAGSSVARDEIRLTPSGGFELVEQGTGSPKTIQFLSQLNVGASTIPLDTPQGMISNSSGDAQGTVNTDVNDTSLTVSTRSQEYYLREGDFTEVTLDIKGDPFWMGQIGSFSNDSEQRLVDYSSGEPHIALRIYMPDTNLLNDQNPTKGDLELASSGLYRVFRIESRLSQGKFSQKLHMQKNRRINSYIVKDLIINL